MRCKISDLIKNEQKQKHRTQNPQEESFNVLVRQQAVLNSLNLRRSEIYVATYIFNLKLCSFDTRYVFEDYRNERPESIFFFKVPSDL